MLNDIYQSLDPVAFSLGPVSVRWYGLAYVLGFALAAFILYRVAKRWKVRITSDDVITIMLCVMVGIIVCARLGYCLFYGDGYYLAHPLDILAFSQGGMSFHGGLVGALLGGVVAWKFTGIPFLTLADLGAIAAPLGLFFGRCANFVNGELWGAPTDLPWGVCSVGPPAPCRAILPSFTRRCWKGWSSSACCTPCPGRCRRGRAARFWAAFWPCTACSASCWNSCGSRTPSWGICGAAGLPWDRCCRCR